MLFLMLSLITDNKNLNLSEIKNDIKSLESMKCNYFYNDAIKGNRMNLDGKMEIYAIEYIIGLNATILSFVIVYGVGIFTPKFGEVNIFMNYIFANMMLTTGTIYATGKLMKEKPSFIKTTLGVLSGNVIAILLVNMISYSAIDFANSLLIFLPPLGGVIGANL